MVIYILMTRWTSANFKTCYVLGFVTGMNYLYYEINVDIS